MNKIILCLKFEDIIIDQNNIKSQCINRKELNLYFV